MRVRAPNIRAAVIVEALDMTHSPSDIPVPDSAPEPPFAMPAMTPPVLRWKPRRAVLNWLAEYNPFYLLSACCMLLGIFVLNDSLDWSPLPQNNLLILIATLNVYELALVILAVVLLRRGLVRDGMFLLLLEAFFLADAGFLNMEIFTTDPATGLIVNAVLFALAVVKVAFLFAATGMPVCGGLFFFVMAQLALLFAIPGVFSDVALRRAGELPMLAVTAAWWAAGLVPVLYVLLVRSRPTFANPALSGAASPSKREKNEDAARFTRLVFTGALQRRVANVFIALPFVSLIAHLCLANWVYKVTFHSSNLSPLLLGLAVWVGRYDWHISTLAWRMRMQLVLPFTAVMLAAIKFPPDLLFDVMGVWVSPLRLAALGATLVYIDGWILHRHAYFAAASILCLVGAGLGVTVKDMNRNSLEFIRFWLIGIIRLVPKTASQWGVVSVVGAFVLLAMGASLSLMKGVRVQRSSDAEET